MDKSPDPDARPHLVVVDDDLYFPHIAARALQRRGFDAVAARDASEALALTDSRTQYAVVDLVLGQESGLALVPKLKAKNSAMRILVLTGYASISTAVEAIKRGASNYLAKPADVDTIAAALRNEGAATEAVLAKPLPLRRLEEAHLRRVLSDCGGNISAAARALKMHRRTLQRKLIKRLREP